MARRANFINEYGKANPDQRVISKEQKTWEQLNESNIVTGNASEFIRNWDVFLFFYYFFPPRNDSTILYSFIYSRIVFYFLLNMLKTGF